MRRLYSLMLLALALTVAGCASTDRKVEEDRLLGTAPEAYARAKSALQREDYAEAVELYGKLEARYPFSEYAERAMLESAYAYYKYDDPGTAVVTVERFLKLHPRHEQVPYAWYLKGLALMSQGNNLLRRYVPRDRAQFDQTSLKQAFDAFSQVVQLAPDSSYAADAARRLEELRNLLAGNELAVAQFYYRRGAYLAAVERAQFLLERYQGAPSMPDALIVSVRAYRALGLADLAAASRSVLAANYPDRVAEADRD